MSFRLDKIYTRSGDKGSTFLIGGTKVSKADIQVECYGTIDELNSYIGVVRTFALKLQNENIAVKQFSEELFSRIQNDLFDIGSVLATSRKNDTEGDLARKMISSFSKGDQKNDRVLYLENQIDGMNSELEPIRSFTLPGGGDINAFSHVARTVCRRLERLMVAWGCENEPYAYLLSYINRLSDLLFVYSRWVAKKLNEQEFLWQTPLENS